MARAKRPWFRFYVEAMHDPKLRRLTPANRWLWVSVLAAARESCRPGYLMVSKDVPFSDADLADYAGMKVKDIETGCASLTALGMIDLDQVLDALFVPRWNERQYESDDVTARTTKHRSKEQVRNVPSSSLGTPPETESETDVKEPPNPQHALGGSDAPQQRKGSRAGGDNPRAVAAVASEAEKVAHAREIAHGIGVNRRVSGIHVDEDEAREAFTSLYRGQPELADAALCGWFDGAVDALAALPGQIAEALS